MPRPREQAGRIPAAADDTVDMPAEADVPAIGCFGTACVASTFRRCDTDASTDKVDGRRATVGMVQQANGMLVQSYGDAEWAALRSSPASAEALAGC